MEPQQRSCDSWARAILLLLAVVGMFGTTAFGQNSLPFEVSNPKHKKWSADEAGRIYNSACELLAKTVRPEKPPELHPQFLLVLGTDGDEFVRNGAANEIHLKAWNPTKFAEAVTMVAAREVLQNDDLVKIVHESVLLAHAKVSVGELRENQ